MPVCALSRALRAAREGGIVGKWSINFLLGSVLVLASASAVQAAELQIIAGGGGIAPAAVELGKEALPTLSR